MTTTLVDRLRQLAAALPPGSSVSLSRDWLLAELEATPAAQAVPALASANGGGSSDEQLLTVQQVAERFGLTPDWLYRHWKTVGGVKLGRKVLRFTAPGIASYVAAQRKADRGRAR